MKTSEFDYQLPQEKIAQTPIETRHNSRLLVLDRSSTELQHTIFHQIGRFLNPGDVLVINKTRVIPARIFARKPTGGRVELLLLKRQDARTWETLARGKKLRPGTRTLLIGDGMLDNDGRFNLNKQGDGVLELVDPGDLALEVSAGVTGFALERMAIVLELDGDAVAFPYRDLTGGFKCFRRKVIESIDLDSIRSDGYSFQIEVNCQIMTTTKPGSDRGKSTYQ